MPETVNKTRLLQVTLAVGVGDYSLANIELAVQMATALDAQVHGLFVEDIDLLQTADLPFSVEITLATAQERRLDMLSIQRSLRAESLQFRENLAQTAERSQVRWSFDTVRGRKIEAGLSGIESTGLMIVGQTLSHRQTPAGTPRKKSIMVFDDETKGLLQVIEVVMELGAAQLVELTVVRSEESGASTLLQALEDKLKNTSNLVLTQLAGYDLESVIKQSAAKPDYIIVSRHQPSEVLRAFLEKSVCPVILVT